jgi:DNA-binding beta-propeller fold protein YncE
MRKNNRQFGFSAVELLITLFIAAVFLISGFQLYVAIIKNGGEARQQANAVNVVTDYLQQYKPSATNPCTAQTPLTNSPITVSGLSNVTVSVAISCPYDNGLLTTLSPATIATGTNPHGITISADGTSVYAVNYSSNTISMYSRNTSTGALTTLGTIATGTNPYNITISADGTSVYATNYSDNTISMYSRNTSTGALTALGTPTIATGSYPRGITISADGTSVYATNYGDNTISMYSRHSIPSVSKILVTVNYNNPQQTIINATYVKP